ncbi:MAG: amino acid ABC transporter permease [Alphaproteobacteria bacterium]|nr:amino acid ABC transporter permease [Alphaproteobacteria bacterium]
MLALVGYLPALLDGLLTTALVAVLSIAGAAVVSVVLGVARSARRAPVKAAAGAAVELLRGASALIYLFWAYYALPAFFPGMPQFSPFVASVLVLSLVGGAYGAEIVAGAIASIPRGQFDACLALGFPPRRAMTHVILPQAASQIVPGFGSLAIDMVKWTSIVSFVGVQDVLYVGNAVRTLTYETVAVYATIGALYWLLCLLTSIGFQAIERALPLNRALRATRTEARSAPALRPAAGATVRP